MVGDSCLPACLALTKGGSGRSLQLSSACGVLWAATTWTPLCGVASRGSLSKPRRPGVLLGLVVWLWCAHVTDLNDSVSSPHSPTPRGQTGPGWPRGPEEQMRALAVRHTVPAAQSHSVGRRNEGSGVLAQEPVTSQLPPARSTPSPLCKPFADSTQVLCTQLVIDPCVVPPRVPSVTRWGSCSCVLSLGQTQGPPPTSWVHRSVQAGERWVLRIT